MDNNRAIYIAIMIIIAIFLFFTDIYYFSYDYFYEFGLAHPWVEERLINAGKTFLFKHSFILRFFIVILTMTGIFLSKVKVKLTEKEKKRSKKTAYFHILFYFK